MGLDQPANASSSPSRAASSSSRSPVPCRGWRSSPLRVDGRRSPSAHRRPISCGPSRSIWQGMTAEPANPVVHLELHTGDLAGAREFYATALRLANERFEAGAGLLPCARDGGRLGGGDRRVPDRASALAPYVEVRRSRELPSGRGGSGAAVLLGRARAPPAGAAWSPRRRAARLPSGSRRGESGAGELAVGPGRDVAGGHPPGPHSVERAGVEDQQERVSPAAVENDRRAEPPRPRPGRPGRRRRRARPGSTLFAQHSVDGARPTSALTIRSTSRSCRHPRRSGRAARCNARS